MIRVSEDNVSKKKKYDFKVSDMYPSPIFHIV